MSIFPANKIQTSKVFDFLHQALSAAGIETARLDARLLLQHVCGFDHAEFIINQDFELSSNQLVHLSEISERRLKREPLSRIFGTAEFWSLNFYLSEDTLDPRPDTETLIELALDMIGSRRNDPLRILDLGTGSGCILLSLLHELSFAVGLGVDKSTGALEIANKNARYLGLDKRADFQKSDWFSSVQGQFDVIVSNPPYIPQAEINQLTPEVRVFDPDLALSGGVDGLAPYHVIFQQIKPFLAPSALLLLEFGQGQEPQLIEMLEKSFPDKEYDTFSLRADLAGITRVIGVQFSS